MAGYLKTILVLVALALAGCSSGPTRDQTLTEQGQAAMQAGDMAGAENLFKEALQENPNNLQAATDLGTVYQNTSRPDEARPLYEQVIAAEPNAKELGYEPEEAARLAQISRDNVIQMDREEVARQEAIMREDAMRREAEAAEMAEMAARAAEQTPMQPMATDSGYRVQVGAFTRPGNAEAMRDRLMGRHANLIMGKEVQLVRGNGMTKVQLAPYSSAEAADSACRELKRAGVSCFRTRK